MTVPAYSVTLQFFNLFFRQISIQYSFSISCQHFNTDSRQTLCRSAIDGSADSVIISDDKRFVSTGF